MVKPSIQDRMQTVKASFSTSMALHPQLMTLNLLSHLLLNHLLTHLDQHLVATLLNNLLMDLNQSSRHKLLLRYQTIMRPSPQTTLVQRAVRPLAKVMDLTRANVRATLDAVTKLTWAFASQLLVLTHVHLILMRLVSITPVDQSVSMDTTSLITTRTGTSWSSSLTDSSTTRKAWASC